VKRIFALLLAALTLLGLTACGEPSDAGPDSPAAENDMDRAKIWLEARIEEDELFSFDYGEVPFQEHIGQWAKNVEEGTDEDGNTTYVLTYEKDSVKAWAEILLRGDMPCIDWCCYFENTASSDSLPISNIQALNSPYAVTDATVNYAYGGNSDGHDFEPLSQSMTETNTLKFECTGGRSSQGYMPFFDVVGDGQGIVVAIGWTGQWTANLTATEDTLTMVAGMTSTDIALHAGESMRTPSIVMTFFTGDRVDGNQVYRDMVQQYYTPADESGEPVTELPLTINAWGGAGVTTQLNTIASAEAIGWPYDVLWVDAGWHGNIASVDTYDMAWAQEVGNWYVNKEIYPDGLSVVSDAVHKEGKEYLLWFEPERVIEGTDIDVNHSEYVMPASDSAMFKLYNLASDEATDYLIELISGILNDNGIDWYRQDFNCDPLDKWVYADTKEGEHRTGITEIKYITNLYRYLDALRENVPGLMIDNCASGGRRLDIEMMKRSVPLWRSDYYVLGVDAATTADGTRNIGWNLSYWIPLSCGGASNEGCDDSYEFRCQMGAGLTMGVPVTNVEWWMEKAEEYLTCREMMNGDYYILAQGTGNNYDSINACYEYYVPEEGRGFLMAFRPEKSMVSKQSFVLRGLDADATYLLEVDDNGETMEVDGETLMTDGITLTFNEARMSLLIYITKK